MPKAIRMYETGGPEVLRWEDLLLHAQDLFEVVEKGAVKIEVRQTYPLAQVAQAHRDLEDRRTAGSSILIPE